VQEGENPALVDSQQNQEDFIIFCKKHFMEHGGQAIKHVLKLEGIFECTTLSDALLSSLLNPLEGPSVLNCESVELGGAPDFQH
jgi:hypothetical protein